MNESEALNSTQSLLESITRTVLYEGYSLYPYHRSSAKNAKPVPFGAVYPRQYGQYNPEIHSTTQTECIFTGTDRTEINIRVKFLHLRDKKLLKIDHEKLGPGQFKSVESITVDDKIYQSGWEAIEREILIGTHNLSDIIDKEIETNIAFKSEQANDLIYNKDETIAGNMLIKQSEITGVVAVSAIPVENEKHGFRLTIKITNTTPVNQAKNCSRNDMYVQSFLSTHTILQVGRGAFISQTDPDSEWKESIDTCQNINTWPILVDNDDKTVLSSPIVLYDYPKIAPESAGDMFDSTEIEEALVLHMATLPENEKERINKNDPKMKAMLERVESVTPKELLSLHGGFKEIKSTKEAGK